MYLCMCERKRICVRVRERERECVYERKQLANIVFVHVMSTQECKTPHPDTMLTIDKAPGNKSWS